VVASSCNTCQLRFVSNTFCQICFCVQIRFVSNTFCVQYVLCPIRFVSNTFCVQYPVQYVVCPIRFVSNMFCVQIRFVSNTFCVQYVLCPILLQWNTSAMAILMQYFCVKIPLFQICFVSLLVPVCFSVTSRLIGNADDLPPLYFSILFNTFQYFSILFNTFQYFSILFTPGRAIFPKKRRTSSVEQWAADHHHLFSCLHPRFHVPQYQHDGRNASRQVTNTAGACFCFGNFD
jgi:hypothetical protein